MLSIVGLAKCEFWHFVSMICRDFIVLNNALVFLNDECNNLYTAVCLKMDCGSWSNINIIFYNIY